MEDQISRLAEEYDFEYREYNDEQEDKTVTVISDYDMLGLLELEKNLELGPSQHLGFKFVDNEELLLVVFDYKPFLSMNEDEVDAYLSDVNFDSDYSFSEELSEILVPIEKTENITQDTLQEKCGAFFNLFGPIIISGLEKEGDQWFVKLWMNVGDIAVSRANLVLSNELTIDCPNCAEDLTYISNGFVCKSCLQYFNQPNLFAGIGSTDETEVISDKLQSNFVEDTSLEEIEDKMDTFKGYIINKSSLEESDRAEIDDGPASPKSVLFDENYPPIFGNEEALVEFSSDDNEEATGECRITGAETNVQTKFGAVQEFSDTIYVYEVIDYISEDLINELNEKYYED